VPLKIFPPVKLLDYGSLAQPALTAVHFRTISSHGISVYGKARIELILPLRSVRFVRES